MTEKTYTAEPGQTSCLVKCGEEIYPLDPRHDLRNHSPTGFNWGYGGSGPAQFALALLADCLTDKLALANYQQFKFEVIGNVAQSERFVITSTAIRAWFDTFAGDRSG